MKLGNWTVLGACLLICAASYATPLGGAALQDKPQESKPAEVARITPDELKTKITKGEPVFVLDVRSSQAFSSSDTKIKGSTYMKYRRIRSRLSMSPLKDVPRDREVVTYCSCPEDETAILAAQVLSSAGFKRVRVLKGGWNAWKKVGGQVETKSKV